VNSLCKALEEIVLTIGFTLTICVAMEYALQAISLRMPEKSRIRRDVESILCPGRWMRNVARRLACLVIGARPTIMWWPFKTLVPERHVVMKKERRLPWLLDGVFTTSGIWCLVLVLMIVVAILPGSQPDELYASYFDAKGLPNMIRYGGCLVCSTVGLLLGWLSRPFAIVLLIPIVYFALCISYCAAISLKALKDVVGVSAALLVLLWGLNSIPFTGNLMDVGMRWLLPRMFLSQSVMLVVLGIDLVVWFVLYFIGRRLWR